MNALASDATKTVAIFLNDFDQEFADGLAKLAKKLGRPLQGVILVDETVKRQGRNTPDTKGAFAQVVCDFSDDVSLRKAVNGFNGSILLVTCSSERNQPYLKRLLPHVPYLLGPTESSLDWATHKAKMREMLGSYDETLIPKVQYVTSDGEAEVQKVCSRLCFPLIVKPTGLASSMLVSKVHDEAELKIALHEGFDRIHEVYSRDSGRGEPGMIVEEFIDGDMYSVDLYVSSTGEVWPLPLIRSRTAHSVGLEGFYIYQADSNVTLDDAETRKGQRAAEQAVHALGLRSCVAHVELFHTDDGWRIIELGPRAGGFRQDLYQVSYGIDHAYNELLVKVGLPPEIGTPAYIAHSTTVNFYPDAEGIIDRIEGFDEAARNPSVYKLSALAKPGDPAAPSTNGGKVVVKGVLRNKDLAQLDKDAASVRATVKVIVRKKAATS